MTTRRPRPLPRLKGRQLWDTSDLAMEVSHEVVANGRYRADVVWRHRDERISSAHAYGLTRDRAEALALLQLAQAELALPVGVEDPSEP